MNKLTAFLQSTVGKVIVSVALLVIGFLGGMEYKAYQIRSAVSEAFAGAFGDQAKKEESVPVSNDLNKKVSFEVTKKSFETVNYMSQNTFMLKFTNNTNKDIEGVQGTVVFRDLFGNQIKRVNVSYDEGIKAGESKLYSAGINYNQFMDDDIKLKDTDLSKLKSEWNVYTIIYKDGTQETV